MSKEPQQTRPFSDWLREQGRGRLHEELSIALQDLVVAVEETGKKGSLVLTINVSKMKNVSKALAVTDVVNLKAPALDRPAQIFFPDRDGNLRRDDPDQLSFDSLREVPAPQPVQTEQVRQAPAAEAPRQVAAPQPVQPVYFEQAAPAPLAAGEGR